MSKVIHAVHVWWRDSSGYAPWQSIDEARQDKPAFCESVGWLVAKTKTQLTLMQSLSKNDRGNATLVIPRECVTRMRYLKDGK